jgi:O-antigen/teichoic acid export membrane protein
MVIDILKSGRLGSLWNLITDRDKAIVWNSVWLTMGEVVSKGIMFLVTILLIRYLSPKEFGHFNIANSLAVTVGMVIDFGLSTMVTRDLAGNLIEAPKYLSNVLSLKLILGLFYLFIIIAIAFFPGFEQYAQWTLVLLFLAIFVWFQDLTGLFAALFMAEERMQKLLYVQMVHYGGMAVSALVMIYFHLRLGGLVTGYVLSGSIGALLAIMLVIMGKVRLSLELDIPFLIRLLKRSLPLFGAIAMTTIYTNADTLIIGRMLGPEAVGFYQGAYKFLFVFQSVNLINTAFFPQLSIYIKSGNHLALSRLHRGITLFTIFILLPAAFSAILLAKPIITLIYGEKMLPAIEPMKFLIGAGVVYFLRVYLGNILIAQDRQKFMFAAVGVGLLFNIFLNIFLIPVYGFVTGGVALVLSEITICGLMWIYTQRGSAHVQISKN